MPKPEARLSKSPLTIIGWATQMAYPFSPRRRWRALRRHPEHRYCLSTLVRKTYQFDLNSLSNSDSQGYYGSQHGAAFNRNRNVLGLEYSLQAVLLSDL